MRKSKTLARIRSGETVRMCCLGHFIPAYVKHAAHFGFDCIWLDLEHRSMTNREVEMLLVHSHLHDIDIMVRPPTLEKSQLYRFLEDGAAGLMIPHVSTPEKAAMLVDSVKFPPVGDRGLDSAGLDADYLVGNGDYLDRVNDETFLVVQVETPQAVENADAIAATPGLDGIFIGPGDLGLRLKHDPVFDLETAISQVAAACQKHQVAWGMPVSTRADLQQRRDQGGQLLAHGGDFRAFLSMLEACAQDFKA